MQSWEAIATLTDSEQVELLLQRARRVVRTKHLRSQTFHQRAQVSVQNRRLRK